MLLLARLLLTGSPGLRFLLPAVLGFHLFAMTADLLFRGGVPHQLWMNVFFGHLAVHDLPGGDRSWLVIALALSGVYVATLTVWLRARRAEAVLGLPTNAAFGGLPGGALRVATVTMLAVDLEWAGGCWCCTPTS